VALAFSDSWVRDRSPSPQDGFFNLNNISAGKFRIRNEPCSNVAFSLESYLKIPLSDETGLEEHYDADLSWPATDEDLNLEGLKRAVRGQPGLQRSPNAQIIEMLVVEKVK
jgi:uncharacterized protein (TIGR03435 family)